MNTETIGAYAPTEVYGQLTSPFVLKNIKINAHTSENTVNKEDSDVYTRDHFQSKIQSKNKYDLTESKTAFSIGETTDSKTVNLNAFSQSALSVSDIVQNSLKQGYSKEQAIVISQAQLAYQRGAFITKDPIGALSSCNYIVS